MEETYVYVIISAILSFGIGFIAHKEWFGKVLKTISKAAMTGLVIVESLKQDADGNVRITSEELKKIKESFMAVIEVWQ